MRAEEKEKKTMMDGRERGRPTSNEMYLKFEIPIYFINNYCVLTVTSSNGWLDDLIMRPYCVYRKRKNVKSAIFFFFFFFLLFF